MQRTKHLLPLEARQRLYLEISRFAEHIRDLEAGARPGGKRGGARRTSLGVMFFPIIGRPRKLPAEGDKERSERPTSSRSSGSGRRFGFPLPRIGDRSTDGSGRASRTKCVQVEVPDTPEGLRRAVSSFSGHI